jgi:hypothetical protein
MEVISRKEAQEKGLKKYLTGKPCKRGHTARRYVASCGCCQCSLSKAKLYAIENPDKVARTARKWAATNPQKVAATQHKYYVANKEKLRAKNRRLRGIPEPTRPEPATCENCSQPSARPHLDVDHDHETGGFRGWLCSNCNTGIGKLGDNETGLLRALDYLRRAKVALAASRRIPSRSEPRDTVLRQQHTVV